MSGERGEQRRLWISDGGDSQARTQFGALCWRRKGREVEVLLVTTRGRGRWIIPKGWPVHGATPAGAAETEAWEEAGVEGRAEPECLGIFSYAKTFATGDALPCVVAVFPLEVRKLHADYPERKERRRRWVSPAKAARLVDEPELSVLLAGFDPSGK